MSQHYSEADLLETYYTQPGESLPVMMHLADCDECAARYERLEKKIRALGACGHDDEPETFWTRQRMSILRKVEDRQRRSAYARVTRIAAAAVLVVGLGGVAMWDRKPDVPPTATPTVATVQEAMPSETAVPADPWDSEQLDDFQSIVAWESWDEKNGDQS